MSRIGKKPINIPKGVEVTVKDNLVTVKGPLGTLSQQIHPLVNVKFEGDVLEVSVAKPDNKEQNSLWGLSRTLLDNLVIGVTKGFSKQLEINGIGFKADVKGNVLVLNVGFSHQVNYEFAKSIKITVEKNIITVTGNNKQEVGQVAAEIRAIKKPEPYKGKGIKYLNEVIRRKAGKAVKSGA